jgi:transcriptional regulator with XRE-family HTH domain
MLYVGQKLRSKREERRWKQETVAKAMNIPQTTLSRIENNQLGVSEEDIQKFAEVLGITVEELQESAKIRVNRHSKFKGNGYTNAEVFQQALSQLQEASHQMKAMIEELKADKAFLKEENHQLRQRDEKWMQMLLDMQRQLAAFLGQNKT